MDVEEFLEQTSRYTMADGRSWLYKAHNLKLAADHILRVQQSSSEDLFNGKEGIPIEEYARIRHNAELFSIYMMLMGYALENCVKGIIICKELEKDPELLKKKHFRDIKFCTKNGEKRNIKIHNLKDLFDAESVSINLTDREKGALEGVTEFVVWFGRYPGPNKFDGGELRDAMKKGAQTSIYYPDERPVILNAIYDKALGELSRLSKPFITWAQSKDR